MKKALLILGAKYEQVPMMHKARSMGYETVAVDFNEHPVGADHCDHFYQVSYADEVRVSQIAQRHGVAGIGTIGTNSAIVVAGRISQRLQLPGLYDSPEILERALRKDLWRPVLEAAGVPVAVGEVCRSFEEVRNSISSMGYPALLKPSDASGSKGINIISQPQDLTEEVFAEAIGFANNRKVVVEEYLGHNSFEVESFVVDGTVHLVVIGERELPPPPLCVGLGCTVPDRLTPAVRTQVAQVNREAIEALEISYGPVHLDMVFDRQGVPRVIDVGPRLVAGPIGWQHIPKSVGVDMVGAVVRQAVGERVEINPKSTGLYCATRHITSKSDGVLDYLDRAEESFNEHQVMSFEFFASEGDRIYQLKHSGHRYGFVTAWDHSYAGVCEKIDSFMEKLHFHFKSGSEATVGECQSNRHACP